MTADDFGTFDRAFRRVCGAFRLRVSSTEITDLSTTYFRLLEGHELTRVLQVSRTFLQTRHRLPVPAEWLSACAPDPVSTATSHRQMTVTDLDIHAQADALRYEAECCNCTDCVSAGVSGKPLRFVPDDTGSHYDRAWNPRRNELQITGHWAHGHELARWYTARAACFQLATRRHIPLATILIRTGADVTMVMASREPGEEG